LRDGSNDDKESTNMLAIRLQRLGRKGLPHYRLIAQDSRFSPTSGRVVEYLGNYNPHTKELNIKKEEIMKRITNGAVPSPRIAAMLVKEGIKLPTWVKVSTKKTGSIKNVDKLRANRPKEEVVAEEPVAEVAEVAEEATPAAEEAAPVVAVEDAAEAPETEAAPAA
jgi:small subunit ribosomal protein S16